MVLHPTTNTKNIFPLLFYNLIIFFSCPTPPPPWAFLFPYYSYFFSLVLSSMHVERSPTLFTFTHMLMPTLSCDTKLLVVTPWEVDDYQHAPPPKIGHCPQWQKLRKLVFKLDFFSPMQPHPWDNILISSKKS